MIRAVLAVALATAILAAAGPAIGTVRVTHADARIDGALDRLQDAARTLIERNDAVVDGTGAATRDVTLHLPTGTWGTAGLERFSVGLGGPGAGTVVRWRVDGGRPSERRLADVTISPARDGYEIRRGGRLRLRLRLVTRGGERLVRVMPLANRTRRPG